MTLQNDDIQKMQRLGHGNFEPMNNEWEKEFDEKFVVYPKPCEVPGWEGKIMLPPSEWKENATIGQIKSFISSLLSAQKKEIEEDFFLNKGVSQWKELGMKFGYWSYFEKTIKKEIVEKIKFKFNGYGGTLGFTLQDLLELLDK